MMKRLFPFLTLLLAALLLACGPQNEAPPPDVLPTQQDPDRPITRVVQTVNLSSDQTWATTLQLLSRRGIRTESLQPSHGRIKTQWLPIKDAQCGAFPRTGAPLSCRVRYTVHIKPLSPVASLFRIDYLEQCEDQELLTLECPNSNAEQLMLSLVDELKRAAGVQEQPLK